jgi:hypothetical protein
MADFFEIPHFENPIDFYAWRKAYLKKFLIKQTTELKTEEDLFNHLLRQIVKFEFNPLAAVLYLWDWGQSDLENRMLEHWQMEIFRDIGLHLENPETRYEPLMMGVASGHGIGKSAGMSMLNIVLLVTHPQTRIIETANTGTQLSNKSWPELKKWLDLSLVKDWFDYQKTSLSILGPDSQNWRSDAITWSVNNLAAFAGLHNQGRRTVILFDEASEIPKEIYEVMQGAITDNNTQSIWLAFGNMTLNSGAFYDLFYGTSMQWRTKHIDSRTVSLTNKKYLSDQVEEYGEDSDFVRVRIRGLPPRTSLSQAIDADWIASAASRKINPNDYMVSPAIVGIDGAWTGNDPLEVYFRLGNYSTHVLTIKKNDNDITTASKIVAAVGRIYDGKIDAWILDQGYGTGIYSALREMGIKHAYLIPFGGKAPEKGYANMRTWIWWQMGIWCRDGGSIFGDVEIEKELSGPEMHTKMTGPQAGWKILESKKNMAVRGVRSPNKADALAVTFALPIQKRESIGTVVSADASAQTISAYQRIGHKSIMKINAYCDSGFKGLY